MADLIRHKRSSIPSAVPAAGDLELGELAVNVADGRLFLKKANGDVADLTSIAGIIGLTEALAGKVNAGDVDFTIIYPNGGSAGSPASVAANTRYVESNPFPGHRVMCSAEINISGEWFDPGVTQTGGTTAYGVRATQLNDGDIVVRTLISGVHQNPALSGSAVSATAVTTSAPCRVKVWKVKGVIA